MAKKKHHNTFWHRVRLKYKLSFFNESTLEEVWSFRLSQLSAFTSLTVFSFLLGAFAALFIIVTPVRNYLPGYLEIEIRGRIVQNALRADSLERMLAIQSLYLDNVTGILMGTTSIDSIRDIDSLAQINTGFDIPRTLIEEDFMARLEEEEKYNLTVLSPSTAIADGLFFYKPVDGIISSEYDANIRHYGIDLVVEPKKSVMSTLDGTIVYTGFDPNDGNVIHVQHRNGFLSIYKHNELILKAQGDHVLAGEAIALVGNTGRLSTGPHLHFELWYRGNPVNPKEYIAF